VILDRFNYAFSSFALSRLQAQETKSPDSAILTVAAEA
jgi:hypothetical protein